eukprot:12648931-Alexandrium_andersonii.AAC.1
MSNARCFISAQPRRGSMRAGTSIARPSDPLDHSVRSCYGQSTHVPRAHTHPTTCNPTLRAVLARYARRCSPGRGGLPHPWQRHVELAGRDCEAPVAGGAQGRSHGDPGREVGPLEGDGDPGGEVGSLGHGEGDPGGEAVPAARDRAVRGR